MTAFTIAAAGALSFPVAASAADAVPVPAPEVQLARTLLERIPAGARIALRPFDPSSTGLPRAVGDRLYESVLNAIVRLAGDAVTVLARERLHEIYASLDEFSQGDIEGLLTAAQADIEIYCNASPDAEGVDLTCSAVDLGEALAVTVAHAAASFTLERPVAPLEIAIADIARRLVDGAPDAGPVDRLMLLESATGGQSGLGAWLAQHLEGELIQRMAERARREGNEARVGETLVLPRPGEGKILSAPMPGSGNREDHEAFVVVAASRPLDFAALAPEAGASLSDTLKRAVDGSRFFAALASQDPARMALVWLPCQVHH